MILLKYYLTCREQNGRSPTRICELVRCRASTQVYALVRIIECKKKKKKMQLVLSNINFWAFSLPAK